METSEGQHKAQVSKTGVSRDEGESCVDNLRDNTATIDLYIKEGV